ncbi:hypothetical protein [Niastella populi]|uniref:Uncharacterized protein n=1 Tax=Niastella populi TaxID=550983 RepID=A0A1V9G357_9BACT|nr:hypothetical protein [Niastella populi]OQP64994.1 hypothetical protein A4R26_33675 [Niastella populi]
MAIYTLSINYIDGISEDKSHLLNVFFKFPNPNTEYKAAMDKSKKLLEHYKVSARSNNDFLTWLDWMSRKPQSFETIDVTIPEHANEEEMYLMIAAATRPYKKIIVGSHQYWKDYYYMCNCNKILYKAEEIEILDKYEAFNELNPNNGIIQNISVMNSNMSNKNNPWVSGTFYLFVAIFIFGGLACCANFVSWAVMPIVIIGGILIIGVIGGLQLRNDDKLKEEGFLKLMGETYKRLPLLRRGNKK